ncbi:Cysteine synthase [Acinetobacter oleivorans]|nr:Cysteine synthase [Acinetobacter oleivorans]CAI3108637.1 Cysteine synthase [Acinetobacter oleivorans]CAI3109856.1 Cysteine synthase [Acinetobacter oleivorans]CAI3109909.1 Cysteine synthase [Acinetobacter oleivorans]CAI3109952.1 Cysteine synthase [Acinetobacter oleivorans]
MNLNKIGNTELKQLTSLSKNGNQIFSKFELSNPTGSHKDRTFLHIIETLEKEELIKPGMTLVDCSTGNGGAALAWIGREKGYKVVICMPEGMTQERIDQINNFGAQIIFTDKEKFLNGSVDAARKYVELNRNAYFLDQASSLLNKNAWHKCGDEITHQLKELKITPDYFVCSIGTGGTFSGIAERLKENFPNIKTIGIEVDKSAPIYAMKNGLNFTHSPHNLMGLGAGVLSANTSLDVIDTITTVNGHEAWNRMKSFIESDQVGIGPTCGANLLVCESLMDNINNKTIVTLFFDNAWKYKSRWDGVYPDYQDKNN